MVFIALGELLLVVACLCPAPLTWILFGYFTLRMLQEKNHQWRRTYFILQGVGIGAILLFFYWHQTVLHSGAQTLRVLVLGTDVRVDGDQLMLTGRVLGQRWQEKIPIFYQLKSPSEQVAWQTLTKSVILNVQGDVQLPNQATNFGTFDYQHYLHSHNITWIMEAKTITTLGMTKGFGVMIANLARQWHDALGTLAIPVVGQYMQSLFFNDAKALDPEVITSYQVIGLIHLFSISGFHVNLLVTILKQIGLRVGIRLDWLDGLTIALLVIYGSLLGWPYGMIRAIGDYGLPHLFKRWRRTLSPLSVTCWSMFLILLLYPLAIFSLSFQLSYALAFLLRFMGQRPSQQKRWLAGMQLSFWCVLVTMPFLIMNYHEFSWVAVFFGELFAGVFTVFLMPLLLILLVAHALGMSGFLYGLQWGVAKMIHFLEWGSQALSQWHFLQWRVGSPGLLVMVILVIAILYYLNSKITMRHQHKGRVLLVSALCLLFISPFLDPRGQVATLDVGQGDTHYLELPHQRGSYLIDACEAPIFKQERWQERQHKSVASRKIIPSLKAQGCRQLDGMFITHADQDHIGAMAEIMANIPVKRLYLPIGMKNSAKGQKIVQHALKGSLAPHPTIVWLKSGDAVTLKNQVTLTVLSPDQVGEGGNETSLVLYGQFGPKTFLFTGDLVGENENKVAKRLKDKHWKIDVLKVAHHGSDHSTKTDWLTQIKPKMAFISVGKKNRYGHPGKRVIEDLNAHHVKIYRTDQQGAIHYYYFHDSWWIKTVQ
ncbi:MAG: DNA internalization-related competence protein ComEC/Rec2 [Aerococcus sp.]|nr:DNA internalization-related competence protein ComEC/Rec2 [Aerococcus sp.]